MAAPNLKRFFITLPDAVENLPAQVTVTDTFAVHHARNVMRLKPGETIIAVDGQRERSYRATLEGLDKTAMQLTLTELLEEIDPSPVRITIAMALVKEPRWDVVLQKSTELGVRILQPLKAERSVVKVDDAEKKRARWDSVLRSAAEQSEGLFIPEIPEPLSVEEYCARLKTDALRVLLMERGEDRKPLRDVLRNSGAKQIVLAIGPEGGWTDTESATFQRHGFQVASLGARILRSETAAIAAVSAVMYEFEGY